MTIRLDTFAGPPLSSVWAGLIRPADGEQWSLFIPRSRAALPLLDTEREYQVALEGEPTIPVLTFHAYDDPDLRQTWLGYIVGEAWILFIPHNGNPPFLSLEKPEPGQTPIPPAIARSNHLLEETHE